MTQKLTLPIQVGKKYVNRAGKIIQISKIEGGVASADGENSVWADTGTVWRKAYEDPEHDLIADYSEPTAHPHAEAMLEYAKDAAVMTEPWKNWEIRYNQRNDTDWQNCVEHPAWNIEYQYRHKQPKVVINGIECVAGLKDPVFDEWCYLASITHSDYYRSVRYNGAYKKYMDRGLVHRTKEDAIAMAKAMLNFQ